MKNLFLFIPLFFAEKINDYSLLWSTFLAFVAFSFVASSIYIINDYFDREADRNHPLKRNRPLVSGKITITQAVIILIVLLLGAILITTFLPNSFAVIITVYVIINLFYSVKGKEIAILDVNIIAVGFLLRVLAGGEVTGIHITNWLILLTYLLALLLALGKRRTEYWFSQENGEKTRKSLNAYNLEFINAAMIFTAGIAVVSYIMYTNSPQVIQRIGNQNIYLTSILVVFGVMRYLQLSMVYNRTESPTQVILTDTIIQIVLLIWIGAFGYVLYF